MQQAAIPPVAVPQAPPPANKLEAVTRFINDYQGGDCFFVQPTRVTEGSAAVEAYGASPRPFMAFDQDFIASNGFEAQIALRQVTAEQCALVSFMAKVAGDRALSPRLEIASFNIRSGQFLEGSVRRQGDRHMELLLVSDDGLVHNLQPFSKRVGNEITYRIKIEGNGVKGSKPQVVLALSSSRHLAALTGGKPLPADKLFPRLVTEAADTGQSLGVAAKYFKLEE
jgi:serine/threonine-protein kinase